MKKYVLAALLVVFNTAAMNLEDLPKMIPTKTDLASFRELFHYFVTVHVAPKSDDEYLLEFAKQHAQKLKQDDLQQLCIDGLDDLENLLLELVAWVGNQKQCVQEQTKDQLKKVVDATMSQHTDWLKTEANELAGVFYCMRIKSVLPDIKMPNSENTVEPSTPTREKTPDLLVFPEAAEDAPPIISRPQSSMKEVVIIKKKKHERSRSL